MLGKKSSCVVSRQSRSFNTNPPSVNRVANEHVNSRLGWFTTSIMSFVLLILTTAFAAAADRPDFAELYENHSDSVVTIHTLSTSGNSRRVQQGIGSGVLISEDELLTAAHVVDGASKISVLFKDGFQVGATVVASLAASDVALIKLKKPHPSPLIAELADSDQTRVGSPVFIIGAPFGISQTLSVGHLSGRLNRGEMAGGAPIEFLQTDTAINTGNSGGPMFNTNGEVIGIVSFIMTKSGGFDGIGFATSSNTAKQALLESTGILAGFEGIMLTPEVASLLNIPQPGLMVHRVVGDSLAASAGLRAGAVPAVIGGQQLMLGGDVILEINGLVCEEPHDFQEIKDSTMQLHDGGAYSIKVFRDGEIMELMAGALPGGVLSDSALQPVEPAANRSDAIGPMDSVDPLDPMDPMDSIDPMEVGSEVKTGY